MSTNTHSYITRHEFDALIASQKAFHEVAIKVTDILRDPSRSAHYQSHPSLNSADTLDVRCGDKGRISHKTTAHVLVGKRTVSGTTAAGKIHINKSASLLQTKHRQN